MGRHTKMVAPCGCAEGAYQDAGGVWRLAPPVHDCAYIKERNAVVAVVAARTSSESFSAEMAAQSAERWPHG